MKSSTIRRSTLSKESMEVIEMLSKDNDYNNAPDVYVRSDDVVEIPYGEVAASKAQEIDMLWQSFKTAQFNTKSPMAYLIIGFIVGVITTLIIQLCMGTFSNGAIQTQTNTERKKLINFEKIFNKAPNNAEEASEEAPEKVNKVVVPTEEETPSNPLNIFKPSAEKTVEQQPQQAQPDTSTMKKYKVKDGDTVEKIIRMHYGSYSPEKAEMIRKANNLKTLDRINIDQELLIPNLE